MTGELTYWLGVAFAAGVVVGGGSVAAAYWVILLRRPGNVND